MQPPFDVIAHNLTLPNQDLQLTGHIGRRLHIPDDVDLTLNFPVLYGPNGNVLQRSDNNGVSLTATVGPQFTKVYTTTQSLAANTTVVITSPFRFTNLFVFSTSAPLKITITPDIGIGGIYTICVANSNNSLLVSGSIVTVLNTSGTLAATLQLTLAAI